jgi:hypothetical protein
METNDIFSPLMRSSNPVALSYIQFQSDKRKIQVEKRRRLKIEKLARN